MKQKEGNQTRMLGSSSLLPGMGAEQRGQQTTFSSLIGGFRQEWAEAVQCSWLCQFPRGRGDREGGGREGRQRGRRETGKIRGREGQTKAEEKEEEGRTKGSYCNPYI